LSPARTTKKLSLKASKKASTGTTKAVPTGTKKVIVQFPEALLDEIEKLSSNRSELIRTAVGSYVAKQKKAKLEQELAEDYQTYAGSDGELL